jgi:DNA-binding YbaB/EbfC family protein
MQPNLGKMLKSMTELQRKMDVIQKELGDAEFEGESAQGLVKVLVTGKGEIKRVTIDPSVMTEDAGLVGDLVVVAAKKAHDAKELVAKGKLATVSAGLLPMGLKIPGLG